MKQKKSINVKKPQTVKRALRLKMAKTRLGDLLLARGHISEHALQAALEEQRRSGTKIGNILLRDNHITRLDLFATLSQQMSARVALIILGITVSIGSLGIDLARAQNQNNGYSYPPTQVAFNVVAPRTSVAPKPTGLFGKSEILSTNLSAFTKWTGVIGRMRDRSNSISALEKAYAPYGLGSIAELKKAPITERIEHINNVVNKVRYTDDIKAYGKNDYWATPMETAARGLADCEDYAIAKYALLKAAGVPESMLRVAIVKDLQKNIPHAVLVVYEAGKAPEILDNQSPFVREASAISWYQPLYSINANAWWRHI